MSSAYLDNEERPPQHSFADVLIILGMHRAGTSALTGVLTKLGAGSPNDPLPSNEGNLRGYFESEKIVQLNDTILTSGGSHWHDWRRFNPSWLESPDGIHSGVVAGDLLREVFVGSQMIVLKDPRMCRLAPLWLNVVRACGATPYVIIPIRSPLEVARSLRARHNFSVAKGLMLWLRHVVDAEFDTRNTRRSFLLWNDLLSDWRSTVDKIARNLSLAWPRQSDFSATEIDDFLNSELKRENVDHGKLINSSEVHQWVQSAYQAMLQLADGRDESQAYATLDQVRAAFNEASTFFGPTLVSLETGMDTRYREAVTLIEEREQARAETGHWRAAHDKAVADLNQHWQKSIADHEKATAHWREQYKGAMAAHDKAVAHWREQFEVANDSKQHIDDLYAAAQAELVEQRIVLETIEASTAWRITAPMRSIGLKLPRTIGTSIRRTIKALYWAATPWKMPERIYSLQARKALDPVVEEPEAASASDTVAEEPAPASASDAVAYAHWVAQYDTLSDVDRSDIRRHIAQFQRSPLLSIIMPVFNPRREFLQAALASVDAQLYPNWELCIADDASDEPHVAPLLLAAAERDRRVKVVVRESNGNICAATNSALSQAKGEFVVFMDHDDVVAEHALYHIAVGILREPEAVLFYSDEDQLDANSQRTRPYFKTDWNVHLMLGQNIVNHLAAYRRETVEMLGGMRIGFEGSQDYDLALRVAASCKPMQIHHIPSILYHWRQQSGTPSFSETHLDRCSAAARSAIGEYLAGVEQHAIVEAHPVVRSWQHIRWPLPDPRPLVSLIIPTKDQAALLERCVDGLLERTAYDNIEVLIVDHESQEAATHALLTRYSMNTRVRVLSHEGPFNYSAINNAAVRQASGSIIGLINNDIDVIRRDWLEEMVSLVARPDIGCVGAKLFYADGRVQHAGIVLGVGGVAGHFFRLLNRGDVGYVGRAVLTSEVSAVTGACLLVRREVFDEVGGLDEQNLPVAFNDVDFCLRVREKGYKNVLAAAAELYHLESATRGPDTDRDKAQRFAKEVGYMIQRWGDKLTTDPHFNPNLSLGSENFELAFPPRSKKPWHEAFADAEAK